MLLCRAAPISHIPSYHTLFAAADEQEANDLNKLLQETSGYFEKLNDGNPLRLGSWQVLWWQPRWYHAEHDGFCHQPISTTEKPTGKPSKIMYSDIEDIEMRNASSGLQTEFVMHCRGGRSFAFKASSEAACASLVDNLRELHARTC